MNVYYGDELERYKAIADITTDRLSEICAAERDGRLVVLPCKVGSTLYYPYAKRVIEKRVTQYRELLRKSECIDKWLCVDFSNDETFEADDIGKTIFLTRAEAEAALKGAEYVMQSKEFQPLRECPFCGGEAEATEYNDSDYTIMCKNCHAEIGWREKAEAIAAWNRRVAD